MAINLAGNALRQRVGRVEGGGGGGGRAQKAAWEGGMLRFNFSMQSIILATDTYYQHACPPPAPPIPSIPPLLSLDLPLEFLQSSCGLRTAGGPASGPGPCVGKGSCEAEHMLCPWFPFPPFPLFSSFGLLLMAPYTRACTINPHGQRHLQFLCIFTLCAGHVPRQQFARRRLLLLLLLIQYLSQSHFAACCSIANNIN